MHRQIRTIFTVVLALVAFSATAAKADFADSIFSKLKTFASEGVDPDQIEMARFSVYHPNEAATVFARAAAEDYPFFALVGAVKAAKNQNLPKIGVFTEAKCLTPITAIDTVFNKASATIDDAQGKASTDASVAVASSLAAQYAQASSTQAKQQLIDELSQEVPYFRDIGAICSFAFETDFSTERNLRAVVSEGARHIRDAYFDFKGGNLIEGVDDLASAGVKPSIACGMIDGAVAGGVIGNTPVLGSLAKGACSSFVGDVIDGAKAVVYSGAKLGAKAARAVGCAVLSIFGDGCSDAPPPPPTGMSVATQWCAPFGGVASFSSKTNQPDDYRVSCNDGASCRADPGKPPKCATAAERAAHAAIQKAQHDAFVAKNNADFATKPAKWAAEFDARWLSQCPDDQCRAGMNFIRVGSLLYIKQRHEQDTEYPYAGHAVYLDQGTAKAAVVLNEAAFRTRLPQWGAQFESRWIGQCQDDQCRAGIRVLKAGTVLTGQQRHAANPKFLYWAMNPAFAEADAKAKALIAESSQRSNELNKKTTQQASGAWETIVIGVWSKQCADAQCVDEVKKLGAQMSIAAKLVQMGDPDASSLSVQGKVGKEYGVKFKAAVDASKARAGAGRPR